MPPQAQLGGLGLVACLPDLDFAWGRHNMETHSLGAAVVAGVVAALVTRGAWHLALATTLAWSTHVLFDWLGSDTTPPLGVMALWPLSSEYFFADAFVFEAISRRYWLPNFWMHNLSAVASEVLLLGPLVSLLWWWRRAGGAGKAGGARRTGKPGGAGRAGGTGKAGKARRGAGGRKSDRVKQFVRRPQPWS